MYIDPVASLYDRSMLTDIVKKTCKDVFIPITVGGGIKSLNDVEKLLKSGADKIAINTAIVENPKLVNDVAKEFGSQCMVASIEVKKIQNNWEVYTLSGREKTGVKVEEWIDKVQSLGAGEILITSIDKEGTRKGFDIDLIKLISKNVKVPMILSGGFGNLEDLKILNIIKEIDAIAIADALHYNRYKIDEIKFEIKKNNWDVRI